MQDEWPLPLPLALADSQVPTSTRAVPSLGLKHDHGDGDRGSEFGLEQGLDRELDSSQEPSRALLDLERGLDRELGDSKDGERLIYWSKDCTGPAFIHSIDFYLIECPPDMSYVDVTIDGETESIYLYGEVTFKEVKLPCAYKVGDECRRERTCSISTAHRALWQRQI